jgi:hypothetical protein
MAAGYSLFLYSSGCYAITYTPFFIKNGTKSSFTCFYSLPLQVGVMDCRKNMTGSRWDSWTAERVIEVRRSIILSFWHQEWVYMAPGYFKRSYLQEFKVSQT